ncbi:MAG TPA: amidohydrolase family protein [Trebonia sp.]
MSAPATGAAVLFRRVAVIDGTGAAPQPGRWVLVTGDRIAASGPEPLPASHPAAAGRVTEIDGSGYSLLPGLINCHVHLCNDGSADTVRQVRDDSVPVATLRAVNNLGTALRAGVTTVRDCGAADDVAIELARAVADGLVTGPRILAAGRVITMTGGHGHFIGREADGPDAVRRAVRTELKAGADFIKAMATGGVLTPGVEPDHGGLAEDELRWVARTARSAGRRTACHAIGARGIKNALRAGIDSIEHGFHLDDEALELAVGNGTFLVPTLVAIESITANAGRPELPAWVIRKAQAESGAHRAAFGAALAAGVSIAAGTDAGTPFNPHGDLARELGLMVDYGMTPLQAIVAATASAARNLGIHREVGTIADGKQADLIMVAGDPAADVSRLGQVALVMRHGQVVHDTLNRD